MRTCAGGYRYDGTKILSTGLHRLNTSACCASRNPMARSSSGLAGRETPRPSAAETWPRRGLREKTAVADLARSRGATAAIASSLVGPRASDAAERAAIGERGGPDELSEVL